MAWRRRRLGFRKLIGVAFAGRRSIYAAPRFRLAPLGLPSEALTFLLDLPPEEGLERVRASRSADRLESEDLDFHRRVRAGFQAIAKKEKDRIILLDASEDVPSLAHRIVEVARRHLGAPR